MVIYWKITTTLGIIGAIIILGSLIKREYLSEKEMKKENYID